MTQPPRRRTVSIASFGSCARPKAGPARAGHALLLADGDDAPTVAERDGGVSRSAGDSNDDGHEREFEIILHLLI